MKMSSICVKSPVEKRTTLSHQLPIHPTSSFEFQSIEEGIAMFKDPEKGHIYGRFANPTVDAVAERIAELEVHGTSLTDTWGIMTSSGMSAISTLLLGLLKQGDKILTQGNLYGGTTELIIKLLSRCGIEAVLTNLRDEEAVNQALSTNSGIKLIFLETPSNPALDCIDLKKISALAKKHGVITAVDNSFCTPLIQQPFRFGIDYVIHSTTKYLNGHGNGISGCVIGIGLENKRKVWTAMKLYGTNCNPFDAWLTASGMKTLALRMERHSFNALELSKCLSGHEKVEKVRYLGLPSHEDHLLAKEQMNGFGGMMCFELKGGFDSGVKFMNEIKIATLAPTMGDVDTLILHPASMSHLNVDSQIRKANGIGDGLIRVSVGIEDIEDLKEDFVRALNAL